MANSIRENFGVMVKLAIIVVTLYIVHDFIVPLIWAAIIAIATHPLYHRWRKLLGNHTTWAALIMTFVVALIIAIPVSWLITILIRETQFVVAFLLKANQYGEPTPTWFAKIPWVGMHLQQYWQAHLSQPKGIEHALASIHLPLSESSAYIRQIGISLAHRGIDFCFTMLSLFFFYKGGAALMHQLNEFARHYIGDSWDRYADHLPIAIRATVNGTILVSLGVGLFMGISYWLAGLPAPALFGFITGILAMIPFGSTAIIAIVAVLLFVKHKILAAILVIAWGIIVNIASDHVFKPMIIGNATSLPFLAVLFGVLGGIQTLGLLGLFLGPIIMVLFMVVWEEPQLGKRSFNSAV